MSAFLPTKLSHRHEWMPLFFHAGGCELSADKNTLPRGVSISTAYPKCRSEKALWPSYLACFPEGEAGARDRNTTLGDPSI